MMLQTLLTILYYIDLVCVFLRIFQFIVDSQVCQISQNLIIDLKMILKNGGKSAAEITKYFKEESELVDPLREQLVDLIIKDRKLSREQMSKLADQICITFPGEKKVLTQLFLKTSDETY